ncbi:MAG TPA: tail sheath stabilizer and completion protein [Candidatus Glassbacteria bacterium]|nr:tail sheath stabilizer and completion protein [Candidatus Glassbacteria bacterium]
MFEYFYHEILRRTVVSFGSLFNEISIKHTDNSGNVKSVIKVPLAYGPTQKFLARLEQSPDLNKPVQITLPRMSFEFTGLTYDSTRKSTTTQTFIAKSAVDGTETKKVYLPVPYNMQFELSIMSKLNDDALQIIEQILPFFQPAYSMTIELVDIINEKRDIPVVLENITMQDDYEGNFSTRRVLIYTLRFTAKTYLFGPVSSATRDVIKKATIGYITGGATDSPTREVIYSAEPRAIKNYTGTIVTNLSKDITTEDTLITVNSVGSIVANTYLDIEGEEVFVKRISGNVLTVERGRDGTPITSHLSGAEVKSITTADNVLIEEGDDFGFNGSSV